MAEERLLAAFGGWAIARKADSSRFQVKPMPFRTFTMHACCPIRQCDKAGLSRIGHAVAIPFPIPLMTTNCAHVHLSLNLV